MGREAFSRGSTQIQRWTLLLSQCPLSSGLDNGRHPELLTCEPHTTAPFPESARRWFSPGSMLAELSAGDSPSLKRSSWILVLVIAFGYSVLWAVQDLNL